MIPKDKVVGPLMTYQTKRERGKCPKKNTVQFLDEERKIVGKRKEAPGKFLPGIERRKHPR